MSKVVVSVARDFSPFPGPRKIDDGDNSGEKFYKAVLAKAFKEYEFVEVDLDGTAGYGSSFLDEAFGSLVRISGIDSSEVLRRLTIVSQEDPFFKDEVIDSIYKARK